MPCIRCQSERILEIATSFGDCCTLYIKNNVIDGYINEKIGINYHSDNLNFKYCLHCGQIQGEFPLPALKIERDLNTCEECGSDNIAKLDWKDANYCRTCGAIQEQTIDL